MKINLEIILVFVFSTLIMIFPVGCKSKKANKGEPSITIKPVHVEAAKRQDISNYLEVSGEIKGDTEVLVFPETVEKIEKINVEIGDKVAKGDKLAELKEGTLIDSNKQALAGLEAVRVNYENAKTEYERISLLYNSGLASNSQLNQSKTLYDGLSAQVKQLEAQVNQTNTIKQKTSILAPISGYIGTINYSEGDMAQPQKPFCTVTRFETVKVISRVSDVDIRHLKEGQKIIANIDSQNIVNRIGKITRISPIIDPMSRTFEVQSKFDNSDFKFRPGMLAELKIEISKKNNAIVIPNKSVVERIDKENSRIFIVDHNKAKERIVRLGLKDGNYVEVIKGVEINNQVVVSGEHLLKDGESVKIVKE